MPAGCSMPSISRSVGATSARIPPSRSSMPVGGDDARHRVQRVRGVRRAVVVEHVVGVAVVGGDEQHAAGRARRPSTTSPRQRSTVSIASTAAGITPVWPTMSAFAKLMIPKRGASSAHAVDERRGGLGRAHLRLVVVGRHVARARHELAPLAVLRGLLAAAEEVRHVRVLLGLGDVQLATAGARDHLRERHARALRRERDRVRPALLVLGQRRVALDRRGAAAIDLGEAPGRRARA